MTMSFEQLVERDKNRDIDKELKESMIYMRDESLKIANSKLASIELVMEDYYKGEYRTIEELAGQISFILKD